MSHLKYIKADKINLKKSSDFNEKYIQEKISQDPSILGLGELILKDVERIQPSAGRLDLLLQDNDGKRYEVELQLGDTDESHIIRAIEYWDYEKKRYPQYEHCAVLVAENITTRFLNVINLINGQIPFIAIQMEALKVEDKLVLNFVKVLSEVQFGTDEEDEGEVTDRAYWESKPSAKTLGLADEILEIINEFKPGGELRYNKYFIGLTYNGMANNFVTFRPRKSMMYVSFKIPKSPEFESWVEDSGKEVSWGKTSKRYRLTLTKEDFVKSKDFIKNLIIRTLEKDDIEKNAA